MNRDWTLWLLIGAALIAATATGVAVYTGARGLRNNNPGNIRHGSSRWQGMSPTQTDDAFVQFTDPVYGIRALTKLLQNYQARYNLNTVEQIISRYAPPTENITGAYVKSVANAIGVDPRAPINVRDVMPQMVKAIIRHENGQQPYPDSVIMEGINRAA